MAEVIHIKKVPVQPMIGDNHKIYQHWKEIFGPTFRIESHFRKKHTKAIILLLTVKELGYICP